MSEQCRLCTDPETILPGDNLPLCTRHWNRWLARFLNADVNAPCRAHLMEGEA